MSPPPLTPGTDPRRHGVARRDLALGLAALAGPLAGLLQLQVNYALTQTACELGGEGLLHLVSLGALLLAAAGALAGWQGWRRLAPDRELRTETGAELGPEGGAGVPRARFLALAGVLLGAYFALTIVALDVPLWILRVCD
jgi:hypothetical protein